MIIETVSLLGLFWRLNELKLNTDFVDKLINNYFSYNTIEYELIDNISMGKDVFLLSDDKNRKRFQYKAYNQLNNTNCEMYINSKKFEFSKYIKINEKNKYISIIYKIINNFKFVFCWVIFETFAEFSEILFESNKLLEFSLFWNFMDLIFFNLR